MTTFAYDLNPVQHIVADAFGEPGKRTFFLQARARRQLVSVVLDKQEVGSLAVSLLQMLEELERQFPHLPRTTATGKALYPEQPFDPIFRVNQLSIGYDEEEDMVWLVAKALITNKEGEIVDPDRNDVPAVRFVATRDQIRALGEHALEVLGRGRPTCPRCGRPIDRGGHFCARTDGHAVPIVF